MRTIRISAESDRIYAIPNSRREPRSVPDGHRRRRARGLEDLLESQITPTFLVVSPVTGGAAAANVSSAIPWRSSPACASAARWEPPIALVVRNRDSENWTDRMATFGEAPSDPRP